MNFNEAENYINSLGMFSKEPSLERIKKAVGVLDCQNTFPVIHIAGTNGKGSVAAYCSSALKSAGYKTGLFISPHILDFCERIEINGEYISRSDFSRITEKIKNAGLELTEFEFITAMCLIYFKEQKVDVAVMETGLGGRLDATNVLNNKLVSVITKIGLDHTAILGDTVKKITREKCGIITGKTVYSPNQPKDAVAVIKEYAKDAVTPDIKELKTVKSDLFGNTFIYKGETYETKMAGIHQTENAVTAIETLKNCGLSISEDDIKSGIKNGFMPARMQVVSKSPLIVIDGAHNPDGANTLAAFMKDYSPVTAVVGVMRDKNYEKVLETTLKYADEVICVKPCDYGRSLDAEDLKETALKYIKNVTATNTHAEAMEKAKKSKKTVFVYGSLYLASEMLKLF